MDHWFDSLTKRLARGTFSRRAMLRLAMGAAGAAFLGRLGGVAQVALAQPGAGSCNVRREGQAQVIALSASSTFKGEPLTYEQTTRSVGKVSTTISKTFRLSGQALLQMETVRQASSIRVRINYGDAFQGINQASLTSTDGKTFRGEVDNRPIVPFSIGSPPSSAKFTDGGPPPKVKIDNNLADAMKALEQQAAKAAATCSPGGGGGGEQGEPAHDSSDAILGSFGCLKCRGECIAAAVVCAVACPFTLWFAFICEGGCAIGETTCLLHCSDSGEGCCPVSCGAVACCAEGETCYSKDIGICCSPGLKPCTNKRCCKASDTCIASTGVCCPAGLKICNNLCCKTGEECVDNKKCCPTQNKCGKTCCDELSKCADPNKSLCCGFANEVCGSVCCKPGEQCTNGKCCSKPCGSVCCGSSQICKDSQCVSVICPSGTVPCVSKAPPGQVALTHVCCPPNVTCCLGKMCCKAGELCCSGPGMPLGCRDPNLCVA